MIAVRARVGCDGGSSASGTNAAGSGGSESGGLSKPFKRSAAASRQGRSEERRRWRPIFLLLCSTVALLSILAILSRAPTSAPVAGYDDNVPGRPPSIAIFTAPGPFSVLDSGSSGAGLDRWQELAIRSWLAMSPDVSVVLFGQHPSVRAFAKALGPRVSVESSDIDFSFSGTPFFHSMVSRATQASSADISVLLDPATILLPDFITALHRAHEMNTDWLLVSMPVTVPQFPFHLDGTGINWVNEYGERVTFPKLREFLVQHDRLSSCSGERFVLAWNGGASATPLHPLVVPPFLYGRGLHDLWLINEVVEAHSRLVIDASGAVSGFYLESGLHSPAEGNLTDTIRKEEPRSWERVTNAHLASVYGTMYFRKGIDFDKIARLVKCRNGKNVIVEPSRNAGFSSQALKSPRAKNSKSPPTCTRNDHSLRMKTTCILANVSKFELEPAASPSFPLSLESLLETVANRDKTVVLTVAADSYRDMLMSWVCRLRKLSVTNFLVCTLDSETYRFAVLQGLPVFKDPMAPSHISFDDCHFGTDCFKRVTKMKSRLVLQILKLGYSVLLSDVDVYWFKNPLPVLRSFGPATLVAQSDEFNKTGPINLPRRLNSGFYFARSDPPTIAAMEEVVKNASMSGLSEQPSFYDVLCGVSGVNRQGSDQCYEPETGLTVQFLKRDLFPNGAYQGLWQKRDVRSACKRRGCFVLHNNWISGRQRKLERQVKSGLWAYDPTTRMCMTGAED